MAFVPVLQTARVRINLTHTGVACAATLDVHDDDVGQYVEAGSLDGLAEDVWNNFRDHIMPLLANAVHMVSVEVQDQSIEDGDQGLFTAAEVIGGIAQQSLPANVALIVKKRTARAGRNFAGRWFLPGLTEQDWQGGGQTPLAAGYVGPFNVALEAFRDGIKDGSRAVGAPQRQMVVASRYNKGPGDATSVPRDAGEWATVTSLTLSPLIGTMRKRIKR